MKKWKLWGAGLFCFCAFFCLSGVKEGGAQKIVTIGGLLNTSGGAAHIGQTSLKGALLAIEEINSKGGITVAGEKYLIKLQNYDDKCVAKDSVAATERLIRNDRVPVILGPICSHCCLADMELTEKEKIVLLTPIASSMKITSMGYKYIFRTWSNAAFQAETITRFAIQDLKLKNGAYIGQNNAWGRSTGEEFQTRLEKRGGKALALDFYDGGTTDFYSVLTKVRNVNPDFIYFCAQTEDGALLVKQARELGIKTQLMGTDDMGNEQFFGLAGNAGNGSYLYWTEGPKKPKALEFEQRYEKKYGIASIPIDKGGYDSLCIIADAIERAGTITDSQKIREALTKTDFEGVRQRYTFAESGQAKIEMWIVKIKQKKVDFVKPIHVYVDPAAPL